MGGILAAMSWPIASTPMDCASALLDAVRRFTAHRAGNAAAAFGLALMPVAAAAGAAVDYTRASDTRAKLQAIVDAAVLNGLKAPASQRVGTAEAHTRSP
jgi:Flp pilus assembly protein TadG